MFLFRKWKKSKKEWRPPKPNHDLPGIDPRLVLDSYPRYHIEGSLESWTYDHEGNKIVTRYEP
jgi:hypothetical protein